MKLITECPATWTKGAEILILSEAPSEQGSSGKLLEKMLLAAGLSKEGVSFCDVVRRRIPDFVREFYTIEKVGGKNTKVPNNELQAWHGKLWEDLVLHPHAVVVACGSEALYALIQLKEIASRRGSAWKVLDEQWVVGMLAPAAILKGAQWQEIMMGIKCLERAAQLARHPKWEETQWEAEVMQGEEAIELIKERAAGGRWALDLETIPGDGKKAGVISVLGVAWEEWGGVRSIIVPWPTGEVWPAIRYAIEMNGRNMAGHNLVYDQAWLAEVGAWPDKPVVPFDTMQRWHALFAELPKSLDYCSAWAIGQRLPYWKDEGKKLHRKKRTTVEQIAYWKYCAKDCVAALWLSRWIESEEEKRGYNHIIWRESNWLVACEMAQRGMLLDTARVGELGHAVGMAGKKSLAQLDTIAPGINPASPMQVMAHVYEKLKLPVQWKGKRKTVDEEALKQIQIKHPTAYVGELMRWRKIEQLRKMFLTPLVIAANREDSTLHCGWIPDATETFRFTSSGHQLGGGLNCQTIPGALRYLFPAPPGRVYIQPDLSQAEARYVAYRSHNQEMIDLFNDPTRNVHKERAKEVFGHEVEKGSFEYLMAKKVVHAGNYREGPKRLSLQLSISLSEAKLLLDRARQRQTMRWHEEIKVLAQTTGKITNCWDQERQCFAAIGMWLATGSIGDREWKELIAWEPQSAIPQIVDRSIWHIRQICTNEEVWFHMHGHDSYVASVPVESVERWVDTILSTFDQTLVVDGQEFKIPVDMQIGWNWGQMVQWAPDWGTKWEQQYPERPAAQIAIEKALESLSLGQGA